MKNILRLIFCLLLFLQWGCNNRQKEIPIKGYLLTKEGYATFIMTNRNQ